MSSRLRRSVGQVCVSGMNKKYSKFKSITYLKHFGSVPSLVLSVNVFVCIGMFA